VFHQEHTTEKYGQMKVGKLSVKYGAVFGGRPEGSIIKSIGYSLVINIADVHWQKPGVTSRFLRIVF
jgi:hypothetical protein